MGEDDAKYGSMGSYSVYYLSPTLESARKLFYQICKERINVMDSRFNILKYAKLIKEMKYRPRKSIWRSYGHHCL